MVKTRLKSQLSCFLVATIILVMAMAPVAVVAQEPATKVVIPSVSLEEGASKTVPITIQNTTDAVSSATVKLWFSPAVVNVTGITKGDFPGSFTPNTFYTADGWVKVVVDVGANPSLTSDKIVIANVTLKAVGSAGASSTLGLEVQSLLNDSFVAVPFTPVNGTFEIPAAQPATKIVIPSVSLEEGASKTVPITIQNTTDAVSSATVKLWFSPAVVNVTGITKGDFPGSFTPNTFYTADGWVKVVVDVGANPSLTSDKIVIANVTLKAVGSAGASSNLGLEVQSLLNDSFVAVPFTPVNGTFTVITSGPEPPTISTYTITNRTIIPPQTASIDVEFSETVAYRIAIEKDTATIYDWVGTAKNPEPKIWNGTYEVNGTRVPDSVYTVNVTGLNTTTGLNVVNNTETITVKAAVDDKPPITTLTAPKMPGEPSPIPSGYALNWTNKTVMLSFFRSDNDGATPSGVNYTAYAMTGANETPWRYVDGYENFTVNVTAEGITTVRYYSVDKAGNNESAKNLTVRIDKTAPSIEFIAPTPANGSTVTVNYVNVTVNVTDESGVSIVLLNWNGQNETMYMIGLNTWSMNKTNLSGGNYTFKVYANDTAGSMGVSTTRTVKVTVGPPKNGDMDGSGSITFDDVILLAKHYYFGDAVYADPDVDNSGTVGFDDVILLAKHYYFGDPIYS